MIAFATSLISYALALVGGGLLFAAPFAARFRAAPPWMRRLLWFVGVTVVCWGLVGLQVCYWWYQFSPPVRTRLIQIKQLLSGASLGLLFLMISSTEFWKLPKPTPPGREPVV